MNIAETRSLQDLEYDKQEMISLVCSLENKVNKLNAQINVASQLIDGLELQIKDYNLQSLDLQNKYEEASKNINNILDDNKLIQTYEKIDTITDLGFENKTTYFHEMAVIISNFATQCEKMIYGTINGIPLDEKDQYYHNNAKFFYDQIQDKKDDL